MTTYLLRGIALAILVLALRVSATSTAWSYQADAALFYQVVADGAGGCGIISITTNGAMCVVRLNKKGEETYRYQLGTSSYGILTIGKKGMVFSEIGSTPYRLIYADAKGQSIIVSSPGYSLLNTMIPAFRSQMYDKKGFFAIEVPTGPGQAKLVRYLNK